MIRKKGKKSKGVSGKRAKKAGNKQQTKGRAKGKSRKKEQDARTVLQQCSKLVKEDATKLTSAVIGEGKKGQLGPVKFLFEMANIFPTADDGSEASAQEESFAETLLHRLGIPTDPVVADEYEKEDAAVMGANKEQSAESASEKEKAAESEQKIEALRDALVASE
jgi:hypothetical protein